VTGSSDAIESQIGAPAPNSPLALIARVLSHAAIWITLFVPMIVALTRGWVPTGDDAAIAFRALQTFSLHPPLVGLLSSAGAGLGHHLYDPGPLLFWLLAIPVRIDAAHGALWGAALIAAVIMSVAVEALWRRGAWIGGLLITLVLVDIAWLAPQVFENLMWNAYFPIPLLIAGAAFAWLVATGTYGWWPLLVFVASVAAQCHLIYVLPAVGLALGAPIIGVLLDGRPSRYRWLLWGLAVGVLCWIAPFAQELGSKGNLSAIATANSGRPTLGLEFGLRALARTAALHPIWTIHQPLTGDAAVALASTSSPVVGVVALVVVAVVGFLALRSGRREAAALNFLALIAAIALVTTFAIFPVANVADLLYLTIVYWLVGPLIWVSVLWGLWVIGAEALARRRRATAATPDGAPLLDPEASSDGSPARRLARPAALLGVALVALVTIAVVVGVHQDASFQPAILEEWNQAMVTTIDHGATSVEASVPRGPVLVSLRSKAKPVGTDAGFIGIWTDEGLAWRLHTDGWQPGLVSFESDYTGLQVPTRRPFYRVQLDFDGTRVVSSTVSYCHLGDARVVCTSPSAPSRSAA
jgi:hypothetical protein